MAVVVNRSQAMLNACLVDRFIRAYLRRLCLIQSRAPKAVRRAQIGLMDLGNAKAQEASLNLVRLLWAVTGPTVLVCLVVLVSANRQCSREERLGGSGEASY